MHHSTGKATRTEKTCSLVLWKIKASHPLLQTAYSLSELNMVHTRQCSKKALIFLGVIKFKDEVKALITSFLLFGCSFLTLFFITDQQYSIVVDMEAEKVSVLLLL